MECVIIFDVIEPLLKDVAAKFNVPSITTNADDVINHPDVNAVWICSPSQFHADQIKVWNPIGIQLEPDWNNSNDGGGNNINNNSNVLTHHFVP